MCVPLHLGGNSMAVTETGGADGHAISAYFPASQGSHITPIDNTETPLTINEELDHDWESRCMCFVEKHAVIQVC